MSSASDPRAAAWNAMPPERRQRAIFHTASLGFAAWFTIERAVLAGARGLGAGRTASGDIYISLREAPDPIVRVGSARIVPLFMVDRCMQASQSAMRGGFGDSLTRQRGAKLAQRIDIEPLVVASLELCPPVGEA